jgi:hypothetical protein
MIRYDVVVICEELATDSASPVLLDDLAIQQFSHFSGRSAFPISPGVMRILNALNPRPGAFIVVAATSNENKSSVTVPMRIVLQ